MFEGIKKALKASQILKVGHLPLQVVFLFSVSNAPLRSLAWFFIQSRERNERLAEKPDGMQIITFDNAERQKRGRGHAFTERGLEVNMHSNYISEHFNYVATQQRNRQKNGRKHGESEA